MHLVVYFVCKHFGAVAALVVLASGVPHEVALQVRRLCEMFVAIIYLTLVPLHEVSCLLVNLMMNAVPVLGHGVETHFYLEIFDSHNRSL